MKKALLIAASLCPFYALVAQTPAPLINSHDAIKAGTELHDAGKFREALKEYDKVSPSDTNYVLALYEKSLTCLSDSQWVKGIGYCREALGLPVDRQRAPELLNQLGSLLDNNNQQQEALHIYDSALALYPHYTLLYVNKATTLIRLSKYKEAEKVLQQALLVDPYSASSHYKLGVCAMTQGNTTAAFLAFATNLLVSPQGNWQRASINFMSEIGRNTDRVAEYVSKRTEEPTESFKMIEQIVASKIALDKNYKALIKLDDPISRQLQVILEKLSFEEQDKDFYMQYYVPFYTAIFKDKKFEYLVNHIFSGVDVKAIKEFNQKNKKDISAFTGEAIEYFNVIRSTQLLAFNKRRDVTDMYYFSDGSLLGKGVAGNNGKTLTGPWTFHYFAGNKKITGAFNPKGEKEGPWKYYYFNGQLKGEETYVAGKQEGAETDYYEDGVVSSRFQYKNGEMEGESRWYYPEGNIKKTENYRNGKVYGARTVYFGSGQVKVTENYQDDKLHGVYKWFHQNGVQSEEGNYVNGEQTGPYRSWYKTGVLSVEAQYEQGKLAGVLKRYHENGKLKSTETYSNGKLEGEYTEYWDNGQLYTKYLNKKGKTSGEVNYYDRDGKVFCVYTFDDDRLRKAVYFNKAGKEVNRSELTDGKLELNIFTADGLKRSTTVYNKKTIPEGEQVYYHASGKPSEKNTYVDGELKGPSSTWHSNGQQGVSMAYEGGNKHGYYTLKNIYGAKKQEGWYQDNVAQGNWIFYNDFGDKSYEANYLNDSYDGYKTEYWENGNVYVVSKYDMDRLLEFTQYDSLGKVLQHVAFPKGNGVYRLLQPNGKVASEVNYRNGYMDGVRTFYYFDGSVNAVQYYKNGLLDSTYKNFFYGGKPYCEGKYRLNEKTGAWKYYTNEGILSSVEEYAFGELHGKKTFYYDNGKVESEIEYTRGEKNGTSRKYSKDGQLVYQLTYVDGNIVSYSYNDKAGKLVPEILLPGCNGPVKAYYANGNVSAVFTYVDDELHGEDNTFHPNGKPWMVSTEFYGNTEKDLKYYSPEGVLLSQYGYARDVAHGPYKEFYPSGKIKTEGGYDKGDIHGTFKRYDEQGKVLETRIYYYGHLLSVKK